jgi:tetratricopeptide (TPR) repeat protein
MLRQFNRFLILAMLVGAALYITLTNSDPATIKLGPSIALTTYAGVIYIAVFVLGCTAASVVALFFGFKGYLRERRFRASERARQSFFKTLESARDLMASGDWAAARLLWEEIIDRDPENVVARAELSRCVEELGDEREALRVLDSTRSSSRASQEVLYRAAILNRKLGNNTAALDNLRLVLSRAPSRHALEMARDTSESIGRFDEALRYQDELESMGYQGDESSEVRPRLLYAQTLKETTQESALKDGLSGIVKRYPSFVPALEHLASVERRHRELDRVADLLAKAARASGNSVEKWRAVVDLWLDPTSGEAGKRTERAIAAAKSSLKDQHGIARLQAEMLVIRTLLAVNHFQDAERLLDGFQDLASREVGVLSPEMESELIIQRGYALAQMGNARDTSPLWKQLASPRSVGGIASKAGSGDATSAGPSPALSTP